MGAGGGVSGSGGKVQACYRTNFSLLYITKISTRLYPLTAIFASTLLDLKIGTMS